MFLREKNLSPVTMILDQGMKGMPSVREKESGSVGATAAQQIRLISGNTALQ